MDPIRPPRGPRPAPKEQWVFGGPGVVFALLGAYLCFRGFVPGEVVHLELESTATKVVAGVFLVVFGLVGVGGAFALLTAGGRMPRWEVDDEGLALWSPLGSAEVPWSDVAAVGVGWKQPPANPSVVVRPPQGHALEVFVRSIDLEAAYPRADRLLVTEDPPFEGLPDRRLRLVLSIDDAEEEVEARLGAYAGGRWLGAYQRTWRRVPGT